MGHRCTGSHCDYCVNIEPPFELTDDDLRSDEHWEAIGAARPKWTGGKALVPLPRDACPECRGPLSERAFGQLPLFVHGGYGAVRTQVTAWCHCGWKLIRSVTEPSPRAVA